MPKNTASPVYEDLKIADIKSTPEFEGVSDEIAEEICLFIKSYTEIIYECFMENRFEEHSSKVITLPSIKNKSAA